jgi:hypothetical protein
LCHVRRNLTPVLILCFCFASIHEIRQVGFHITPLRGFTHEEEAIQACEEFTGEDSEQEVEG